MRLFGLAREGSFPKWNGFRAIPCLHGFKLQMEEVFRELSAVTGKRQWPRAAARAGALAWCSTGDLDIMMLRW